MWCGWEILVTRTGMVARRVSQTYSDGQDQAQGTGPPAMWPIYIVDFTDGVTRQRCKNIERVIGKERAITLSDRSREDDNGL
jgi:hypothetical protein